MNRSFRVGRLGATYCWRVGGQSRLRWLQKRHYADRYVFDDMTQSRIEAMYKAPAVAEPPRENPWRTNYPDNLNDIGYESHCNDRLYMAKNRHRQSQSEYDQKRLERRLETQKRVRKHFNTDVNAENSEFRKMALMKDLSEHQQRQEDIIEMNRRLWQSRPQVKREVNLSGITYRPDQHKHLMAQAQQKSQDLDRQRDLVRYQDNSEAEAEQWVRKKMGQGVAETKAEAEETAYERRMNRLMGKYNADQDAERADWRSNRPMAEAEKESNSDDNWWTRKPTSQRDAEPEDDWRTAGQGSALQKRLMELMEAESKPEAEKEDWRGKSPKAEAEEDDWRVKAPRGEAEEDDWRVRGRRPEAEEDDWRVKAPRGEAEEDDWRVRGRRPEAEEDDWRVRVPRGEAEEMSWRMKSRRPEAEEDDWRVRVPRAEDDWRVKRRRPEAEEDDWRMGSPRAEAEEDDWRLKGSGKDSPVRSQYTGHVLQQRLMELMEAEKKPEAEEDDWRTQSPKAEAEAEAEDSPRAEAETQEEAEEKAWKARNLSLVYDPNSPANSWKKKRQDEIESQYWHSWHTCPDSQEAETTVELKTHPRRRKVTVRPPAYTRDGQRRSYHQTALNPQPMEVQPEPLANEPLMPRPLRAIPKKEKKSKPKRKRERRSVEPPRFKMTIKSRPIVPRRPTPVPSYLRRLNQLSKVAGPSFHMANLQKTLLNASYAG